MKQSFNITPWLLLIPLFVIIMVAMKTPAIPGLFIGTLLGGAASMMFQNKAFSDVVGAMMNGVASETGNEVLDKLLSGGGLTDMFWTISLIFAALTFGGILEKTGMLDVLAKGILNYAKSTGALVTATVLSCIFVNVLAGDQYLSIVLPGKMYKEEYHRRGLAPRNLSRALEDAGTLTSPLVPWNTCGAMMTTYLGVSTFEYLPYCFLNLINPAVSILYGYFGVTIMKLEDDPSAPEYKMAKSTAAV
jgi:NhaC family Na+:H+ antiporter